MPKTPRLHRPLPNLVGKDTRRIDGERNDARVIHETSDEDRQQGPEELFLPCPPPSSASCNFGEDYSRAPLPVAPAPHRPRPPAPPLALMSRSIWFLLRLSPTSTSIQASAEREYSPKLPHLSKRNIQWNGIGHDNERIPSIRHLSYSSKHQSSNNPAPRLSPFGYSVRSHPWSDPSISTLIRAFVEPRHWPLQRHPWRRKFQYTEIYPDSLFEPSICR